MPKPIAAKMANYIASERRVHGTALHVYNKNSEAVFLG